MRIAVLGAGAMGALYGGYLSKNNDVMLIDVYQALTEKISSDGLIIHEPDHTKNTYHPAAFSDTTGEAAVDLMIVFVKAMYSESALEANRHLIGKDTCIMTLQNGSGHEDTLLKFVDEDHVIIGTTQHNSAVAGLGEINHGGSGITYLGNLTGHAEQFQSIADNFTACGLETKCSDDVQKLIWHKMFTNVSASVLTGVLQVPLGYISTNEYAWTMCRKLIQEAVAAAKGLGIEFDADVIMSEVKAVCDNSPEGKTSIYADIQAGRKTEVDTISGSIVRAAAKSSTPVPTHELMVNLVHALEGKQNR